MEKNAGPGITYFLAISTAYRESLARIRHWSNLKVGFEDGLIWIKDFDLTQILSQEVRSIPFGLPYYERDNYLCPLDSKLPERVAPGLLWTPIDRALPLSRPPLNHNYFGIADKVSVNLVNTDHETDSVGLITSTDYLKRYLETAPSIRLEKIRWALLDSDKAFLLGTPLLPIPGDTLWARKDLLLPSGMDFEFSILSDAIQKRINPGRDFWVIWYSDGTYFRIPKEKVMPLSRSSFRLTITNPEEQL